MRIKDIKKLTLKKSTIVNLDKAALNSIKGAGNGGDTIIASLCTRC